MTLAKIFKGFFAVKRLFFKSGVRRGLRSWVEVRGLVGVIGVRRRAG